MSRIGDPSSKYAYCPHKLDADIQDKQEVGKIALEGAKQAVGGFLFHPYTYSDGIPMSLADRWATLIQAVREMKEALGV